MSLLKRIESARPGTTGPGTAPGNAPVPTGGAPETPGQPSAATQAQRLMSSQGPVRESFRDVKFRIQSRVIQDLDPKLDLSNQVEVRRQIEEIFQTEAQVTERRRSRHAVLDCDPAVQVARAARRVRVERSATAPVDATLTLIKQLRWDNQPGVVASAA